MRILVAEDNTTLADALATVLRNAGYAVDVVNDGVSADAVAASTDFDLVILDLNLPEMDGLDVLRGLSQRRSTS
jgi:two-component system OmpR family response regulator